MSKIERYESEKRAWLWLHQDATPEQAEKALRAIARRIGL